MDRFGLWPLPLRVLLFLIACFIPLAVFTALICLTEAGSVAGLRTRPVFVNAEVKAKRVVHEQRTVYEIQYSFVAAGWRYSAGDFLGRDNRWAEVSAEKYAALSAGRPVDAVYERGNPRNNRLSDTLAVWQTPFNAWFAGFLPLFALLGILIARWIRSRF